MTGMARTFTLLSETSKHVARSTSLDTLKAELRAAGRKARSAWRRFDGCGCMPCGYQDYYGDLAEAAGLEYQALAMAYLIRAYGGCKRFGEVIERAQDWVVTV